ncbi:MAG: hypothetical protein ACXAB2_04925 [Candidatus Hodarchaeales archaeon]|jgi:hypothetical protein
MRHNPIIFLATYAYLAIPQYLSITPNLTGCTKVLFNTRDILSTKYDDKFITPNIKKNYFDEYCELKDISLTVKGPWKKLQAFRQWKREIIQILNRISPQVVVSCSDQSMSDKLISSWCKKNNKNFIVLQPAFINPLYYEKYGIIHKIKYLIFNKLLNIPRYRKQHLFGNEENWTHLLLWSQYFIENPKRSNMHFVGNPAFDEIFSQFTGKRTLKKNVLICTQDIKEMLGKEAFDQVTNMYLQAIRAKEDLTFYIKVHPRESIEKYKLLFSKNDFPNTKVVQEENLYDLFRICDVQISVSSYTSFEAVAMGLPIIIVNPNNVFNFIDHFREEIEIKVTDSEKIVNAIDLARSEDYWLEFIKKREIYFNYMVHSTDGQSGKRAAEKILEIINFSG